MPPFFMDVIPIVVFRQCEVYAIARGYCQRLSEKIFRCAKNRGKIWML